MIKRVAASFVAVLFASICAHAQTPSTPAVGYAAGGVGYDEMQQLKSREKEFNLKLVFTLLEGNYLADVGVNVKDAAGASLLALDVPGPVVLARFPRGAYIVEATYGGKTQTRKVKLGEGLRTEFLRWPSNPEYDFPVPKSLH